MLSQPHIICTSCHLYIILSLFYIIFISYFRYIILSILKGSQAFQYCSSLTQVVLTGGLLVLAANMFDMGTGFTLLSAITIASTATSFGRDYYFYRCYGGQVDVVDLYISIFKPL